MANLTTSADILDDALFRCGEATDTSSDFYNDAINHLNRGYREVWMGGGAIHPQVNEDWWWLRAEASLILDPITKTGTVSVTQNNATITFSSAPADSKTGWFFKVDDHNDVFKISSHTGGNTNATLDTVYTGDTDATASYRVMNVEYDLASDFMKLVGPMRQYQKPPFNILVQSSRSVEDDYPFHKIASGAPTRGFFIDTNTVRFNAYGDEDGDYIRVDYDYLKQPTALADDSNEPLMPLQYRHILSDIVCMYLMTDKNDTRAVDMGVLAKQGLIGMQRENRQRWAAMGVPGKITPRQDLLPRRVLKTEGGLVLGVNG